MKEIISAVAVIVGLWQGTIMLNSFYNSVKKAALEKAAQGLPPLAPFTAKLTHKRSPHGSKEKNEHHEKR